MEETSIHFLFPNGSLVQTIRLVFFVLGGFGIFFLEFKGIFHLPYSKFAKDSGISPKLGMFTIYFLPILAFFYTIQVPFVSHLNFALFSFAVFFHFAKRCAESLFLHKYSGKIGWVAVVFISVAYSNIAILLAETQNQLPVAMHQNFFSPILSLGLFLFGLGELGNLYHHWLLRSLRKNPVETRYTIPEGGLFAWVVCPHYLFEILAWIGISLLSLHWEAFGATFVMSLYLLGRSHQTRIFYWNRIPNFPKDRRRIVPFVF